MILYIIASFLRLPRVDRSHYPVLGPDPTTDEVVAGALRRDGLQVVVPTATHPTDDIFAEDIDQPYIHDLPVFDPVHDPALAQGLTVADLDHHYEQIHQDFFLLVMGHIEHQD
ncbi:hypothetical protein F0562_013671 [Nyssa sinensis]|uniref:Uncharacterized protein n=1 Tax=Nyssa sinensis TaxID=561372 RepID=A0A5J4ZNP6_9ASTE|nr:hypothetical protein F0562_013671 [Nyssa sinensis]